MIPEHLPKMREYAPTVYRTPVRLPRVRAPPLLRIGDETLVEITGLRDPCTQIDDYQQGLRESWDRLGRRNGAPWRPASVHFSWIRVRSARPVSRSPRRTPTDPPRTRR
jgi:hypothetical protein